MRAISMLVEDVTSTRNSLLQKGIQAAFISSLLARILCREGYCAGTCAGTCAEQEQSFFCQEHATCIHQIPEDVPGARNAGEGANPMVETARSSVKRSTRIMLVVLVLVEVRRDGGWFDVSACY